MFQNLRPFHLIQRMICSLLALLSLMMRVAMMIILLNLHIQNQRDISSNMLLQRRRPHHYHRRHLILPQREKQCHPILIQRERIHLQREITVKIMSGLRIRIIVWSVWSWIENYMPFTCGHHQWPPMTNNLYQKRKRLNYKWYRRSLKDESSVTLNSMHLAESIPTISELLDIPISNSITLAENYCGY